MNNVIGDVNVTNNYSSWQEVSPREKLLNRSCSRATFNGDIRADAPKCHPDTRKSIIASIKSWAADKSCESYLFWLRGSVGTGKSAIARRVCEELDEEDPALLAGSFFFWRNDGDRNSLKTFIATIVYRILVVMPEVGRVIEDVISKDPSILDATLEYQWNALVIKPLCQVPSDDITRRSLIVIDGLDECEPSSSQRQILNLLVIFHKQGLSHQFSFLICSRPEAHIQSEMDLLESEYPAYFLPSLMLCDTKESREDMRLILTSGFRSIFQRRRLVIGQHPWPPEGAISRIIALANGQFIYALTVFRWLDDDEGHPIDRLDVIFKTTCDEKARALAPLDQLYDLILSSACSKKMGNLVLPCLFYITNRNGCQRVALESLSELMGMDSNRLRVVLQPLHSVLRVPVHPNEFSIRIYHTSFVDYLHDASRSGTYSVLSPTTTADSLAKAMKWANTDVAEVNSDSEQLIFWLRVHSSIPKESNMFTSELLDALVRMDAKHWLRVHLLFVPLDIADYHQDKIREKYNIFQQWLMTHCPEEQKDRLAGNFPPDLFPPPGRDHYGYHWLYHWTQDFRAGILSPPQMVLFICLLLLLSAEACGVPARGPIWELVKDCRICFAGPHTCQAQDLVLSAPEYLAARHAYPWKYFCYNIFRHFPGPYGGYFGSISEVGEKIFSPLVVLNFVLSKPLTYVEDTLGLWKKICNSQHRIKVDRQSLVVLQSIIQHRFQPRSSAVDSDEVRAEFAQTIKDLGMIAPAPLVEYWKHTDHTSFSESSVAYMTAIIEKEMEKYPMECRCDEILGLKPAVPDLHPAILDSQASPWSTALTCLRSLFCCGR
ncbi:hypothetical protein AX16_009219 [Volvariella volvacea WC 439]|nr:hypothetical protein AX16_009219 [Volvariella volvacea WC 439]